MKILLLILLLTQNSYLFIGDSLTCYQNGWQDQLSKSEKSICVNHAKGGKRTDWMLTQLTKDLSESHSYKRVYIYGGINDAFSSVSTETTINNLQRLINLCRKYKIEPILVIGYDPNKVNVKTVYSSETEIKCRNKYVDLQKKMMKLDVYKIPIDTTLTRADSDDGIHLNASGHNKFSKWVISHDKKQ